MRSPNTFCVSINKNVAQLIFSLFFLCGSYPLKASLKQFSDSLEAEMGKQFRLDIVAVSPKGNYAAVAKRHNLNSDTVMIVNASKPGKVIKEIIGLRSGTFFPSENSVVAFGSGKAEYMDLKTTITKKFENVKSVTEISEKKIFIILNTSKKLSAYNQNGNFLYDILGVEKLSVTGEKGYFCIVKKKDDQYEVVDVSSTKPVTVYRTQNLIKRIEVSFSKTWLSVIEEVIEMGETKESLVLINRLSHVLYRPQIEEITKDQMIGLSEMAGGKGLLISLNSKSQKDKKVEIWYGNDGNLIDTQLGFSPQSQYMVFDPRHNQIKKIHSDRFDTFYPTGNKRYLLARKRGKGNNYTHGFTTLELYLHDLRTGEYKFLDSIFSAKVFMPSKGNSLLYKNNSGKWLLINVSNGQKREFTQDFVQPIFSRISDVIYFEGKTGFFVYDIKKDELRSDSDLDGKDVRITERRYLNMGSSFMSLFILEAESKKLLLKVTDTKTIETSYKWFNEGKLTNFISPTSDYIDELQCSSETGIGWFLRENYNRPMSAWVKSSGKSSPSEIIPPNKMDNSAASLKQEILEYKNSEGKVLKSILYYPENFNPKEKYPMIVRIYEEQNYLRNRYQSSSYELPLEIDIRAMLKKGYFVYLPDIIIGKKGSGLSALDCVHSSLNVLRSKEFIDLSKVGLTGHSHGGYETNFIATHSDRFTAFFSGSGNSDIIRSYFSYNNNFHSPYYYQFEVGQYNFNKSFAEDKERYFRNNPIHYAENVSAPILLWAGKKDENIVWEQSMEFYIALKRNKKDVIGIFYPNQGHYPEFSSEENKDLHKRMIDWWDYFLKDKKNIPWIDQQMKKDAD